MIAFAVGVAVGVVLTCGGLTLFAKWKTPKLEAEVEEIADARAKRAVARAWEHFEPEAQKISREQADIARDAIELGALRRLVEATNQSVRTGRPVRVTFAGHEDVICVTPPPTTPKAPNAIN